MDFKDAPNDAFKEYSALVRDVREDYMQRAKNDPSNADLLWCDLCDQVNLWTYWQGIGNLHAKILLVGQDWGCIFDKSFSKFKHIIERMNAGDFSVNYTETTTFDTDKNLIELFKVLGYHLERKENDLFFTNLVLGYRKERSTGKIKKEYFLKDLLYLERLVKIIKPSIIICLGKDTYEITASALCRKKIRIKNFYHALECDENYSICDHYDKSIRIYGVAHCGFYGVINRKKYNVNSNILEDGLELQKRDWEKIKNYLEQVP